MIDGKDLRTMSRAELIALKTEMELRHADCKAQFQEACTRFNTTGVSADADWLSRVRGSMRSYVSKAHKINLRLAELRAENHTKSMTKAATDRRIPSGHLGLLHALYRVARAKAQQDPAFSVVFGELLESARALVEDARDAEIACDRLQELKEDPTSLVSGKELQDELRSES
jgi:hypothetical protein